LLKGFFGGLSMVQLAKHFNSIDVNRSGTLSWDELVFAAGGDVPDELEAQKRAAALNRPPAEDPLTSNKFGVSELKVLYDRMDVKSNNCVEIKQWIRMVVKYSDKLLGFFGGGLSELASKFNHLDRDHSGTLTWEEVRDAAGGDVPKELAVMRAKGLGGAAGNRNQHLHGKRLKGRDPKLIPKSRAALH